MTIPSDRNITLKEIEKKSKYKPHEKQSDPCGGWCTWYNKEGDGRKHQECIRESYSDRDPKDQHAGICRSPSEGAHCMN